LVGKIKRLAGGWAKNNKVVGGMEGFLSDSQKLQQRHTKSMSGQIENY
jgi:hypothetical protein